VKGSALENVDTVGERRKSAVVLDYCSQVRTTVCCRRSGPLMALSIPIDLSQCKGSQQ
jgi:hypothetical protein